MNYPFNHGKASDIPLLQNLSTLHSSCVLLSPSSRSPETPAS